jgi:RimJ/RimL family protein N-acetyltransferase
MFAEDESLEDDDECLTTRRLVMVAPRREDAAALAALADNPKIATNLATMPHPYERADAEAWIARVTTPSPGRGLLVRLRRPGMPVIGAVGFGPQPTTGDTEVGYWIGEPFWNQGYATEAAQAVIDHAFRSSALDEVWASCRMTNEASRRVIVKCGFQWVGTGLRHSKALRGMMSVERYRLDRKCWQALRAWGDHRGAAGEKQTTPAPGPRDDGVWR